MYSELTHHGVAVPVEHSVAGLVTAKCGEPSAQGAYPRIALPTGYVMVLGSLVCPVNDGSPVTNELGELPVRLPVSAIPLCGSCCGSGSSAEVPTVLQRELRR